MEGGREEKGGSGGNEERQVDADIERRLRGACKMALVSPWAFADLDGSLTAGDLPEGDG